MTPTTAGTDEFPSDMCLVAEAPDRTADPTLDFLQQWARLAAFCMKSGIRQNLASRPLYPLFHTLCPLSDTSLLPGALGGFCPHLFPLPILSPSHSPQLC